MRGEAQPKRGAAREGATATLRSRSSGVAGGAKSAALRTTSPKVMAARDRDARATSRSVSPCVVRRSALAEARLFRVVANGVALRNSMHAADKVETKGSGPLRHSIVSAARVGERWLRVCNSGFYLPFELDGVRLFEPVQDVKPHDRIWTVPRTKGPLHAPKDHHTSTTSATTSASSAAHPTGRRVRRAGKSPLRHVSRDFSAPLLHTGSAAAAAHKDPSSATGTPRLSGRPRLTSRASASSAATSSSAAAAAAAAAAKDEKYSAAAVCAAAAASQQRQQQQQQLRLRSPPPAAVTSPSAAAAATSTATFRRTLSTVVSHDGDPRSPSPVRTPSRSRSPATAAAAESRSSPASRSPAASSAHANVRRSLSGSASRGGSSSPQTPQTQLRRLSSPAASERRRGSPSVASTAATTTTTTAGRHSRGKSPSPTGSAVSSEGLTSDTNTQSSTSEVECIKSQLMRVVRGLESGCDKDQAVRALKDVLSGGTGTGGGGGGGAPAASSASSSFSSSSDNDALLSQLSALLDLESESTRRDRGLEARLRDEAQARRKIERELEDMKRRYEEEVAHGGAAGVGTSSSPCPKASTFIPLPHPHPCEEDVQQRRSVGVPPRASLRGGPQRMSVGHDAHDPSGSRMLRGRSFQGLESRSGSGRSTPRSSVGSGGKGSPPSGGSVRVRVEEQADMCAPPPVAPAPEHSSPTNASCSPVDTRDYSPEKRTSRHRQMGPARDGEHEQRSRSSRADDSLVARARWKASETARSLGMAPPDSAAHRSNSASSDRSDRTGSPPPSPRSLAAPPPRPTPYLRERAESAGARTPESRSLSSERVSSSPSRSPSRERALQKVPAPLTFRHLSRPGKREITL